MLFSYLSLLIHWFFLNQDRHADGQRSPDIDSKQDWSLLAARETPTHTMIKFSRLLNTNDNEDIPITVRLDTPVHDIEMI